MFKSNKNLQPRIEDTYGHNDVAFRQKRLKNVLSFSIFFVIGSSLLDLIMYPNIAYKLIEVKFFTVAVLVILSLVLNSKKAKNLKFLGILVPITIFILIDIIMFLTGGHISPYYAGLTLIVATLSIFSAWTFYEALCACCIMMCLYTLTIMSHMFITSSQYNLPILASNLFFLISTSVICVIIAYVNSKSRLRRFNLEHSLEMANQELANAQTQLIQGEKMIIVDGLFDGILHEVSKTVDLNIVALQSIKINDKIDKNQDLKNIVNDIEEKMMRVKNIVSNFTRKSNGS